MMTASRCDLLTIKSGSKLQKPPTETQVATAKGKGKVKPRKSQPGQDVVHAAVPRLLDSEYVTER